MITRNKVRSINDIATLFTYTMKSNMGIADVVIEVEAEDGGHGCLYAIRLPAMVASENFGNTNIACMKEVFQVLNCILREFNCSERVVTSEQMKAAISSLGEFSESPQVETRSNEEIAWEEDKADGFLDSTDPHP